MNPADTLRAVTYHVQNMTIFDVPWYLSLAFSVWFLLKAFEICLRIFTDYEPIKTFPYFKSED